MHDSLAQTIRELRTLAAGLDEAKAARDLESAEHRLSETAFRLLVIGEFKRGKSSLVNALLGHDLLPTGVVPLTSIVTEIRYAPWRGARILFAHGQEREIALDELTQFITEPGNPRNQKGILRAIVADPAPLLGKGVTILDTPGIASIFGHNSQVTIESLHEADAVVLVLAADQPLTAEEHRLLERLRGVTDHVLIAVNRMDVLAVDDRARSLEFVRQSLAALRAGNPELVYPIAAGPALEARVHGAAVPAEFLAFESALHRVLIDRKSDLLAERARILTRQCAERLALRLAAEEKAQQLSADQLERTIAAFQRAATDLARQIDQAGILLRHSLDRARNDELTGLAQAASARIRSTIWPRVEAELDRRRTEPVRRVFHDLSDRIGEWVVDELEVYYLESESLMRASLQRAVDEYAAQLHDATREVVALANQLLDAPTQVPHAIVPVDEVPRFYLRAWGGAGGHMLFHDWWLVLPRAWAERRARRELRLILDRRIQQNLGAIRYDWTTRLDEAIRKFDANSHEQGRSLMGSIEHALRAALGRREESASARTERANSIARARANVAAILCQLAEADRVESA